MTTAKPMPVIDHLSAPYWEGCRAHRLRLQRCVDCGKHRFPSGPVCPSCQSARAEWIEARGTGRVYSWIVVRHPIPAEIYAEEVPYVVALVELDEGPRMPTNIVGCDPDAVTAGMPVEVTFRDVDERISLPVFHPARSAA